MAPFFRVATVALARAQSLIVNFFVLPCVCVFSNTESQQQ